MITQLIFLVMSNINC